MRNAISISLALALGAALAAHAALAQSPAPPSHQEEQTPPGGMDHSATHHGTSHGPGQAGTPGLPGQDAFGAIAEVVRLLDADPKTDWGKVNLERLRQHLIDMNEVVLRSTVRQNPVPGGLVMEVTGAGRTEAAIRGMVVAHAAELDRMAEWSARAEPIEAGVRLTVTLKGPDSAQALARLRGLGLIGLLTVGAHHGPHHLALAKGEPLPSHSH